MYTSASLQIKVKTSVNKGHCRSSLVCFLTRMKLKAGYISVVGFLKPRTHRNVLNLALWVSEYETRFVLKDKPSLIHEG